MKILIIRFKMIGDVLLTSVIGNSLRESFPDARIDYLMHNNSAPLFEFESSFDNIYALTPTQRSNPFQYLAAIWAITRNDYDVVIDAAGTAKSELISVLARSARIRIGREKKGRGWAYTHALPKAALPVNKIEQRLAMLEPLREAGLEIRLNRKVIVHLQADEVAQMRARLTSAGVNFNKPRFAFATSARERHKAWPQARMQAVIDACQKHYDAQVLLLAGLPHERAQVRDLFQTMGQPLHVFSNIQCESLRELAALIHCCNLFVGNEGGPRHIASAVGVASLAIVSPSASKAEWLSADSSYHKAIEWRDIDPGAHHAAGSVSPADPEYQNLYRLITVEHVMDKLDLLAQQIPGVELVQSPV